MRSIIRHLLGPVLLVLAATDHTHTNPTGASFNAQVLTGAIRALPGGNLGGHLLPGDLWLPSVFSDHMVLQHGLPLPVWGTARPGAEVTARIEIKKGRDNITFSWNRCDAE